MPYQLLQDNLKKDIRVSTSHPHPISHHHLTTQAAQKILLFRQDNPLKMQYADNPLPLHPNDDQIKSLHLERIHPFLQTLFHRLTQIESVDHLYRIPEGEVDDAER